MHHTGGPGGSPHRPAAPSSTAAFDTAEVDLACARLRAHVALVPEVAAAGRRLLQGVDILAPAESLLGRLGARGKFLRFQRGASALAPPLATGQAAAAAAAAVGFAVESSAAPAGDVAPPRPAGRAGCCPSAGVDGGRSFFSSPAFQHEHNASAFGRELFARADNAVENPAFLGRVLRELNVADLFADGQASLGASAVVARCSLPLRGDLADGAHLACRRAEERLDHTHLKRMQNRKWALAQVEQGVRYNADHDFLAAIRCYDKALQLDSRCPDAYVSRGAAHVNLRQFGRAVGDFQLALKYDPSHANAAKYLEVAQQQLGLTPAPAAAAPTGARALDAQSGHGSHSGRDKGSGSKGRTLSRSSGSNGRTSVFQYGGAAAASADANGAAESAAPAHSVSMWVRPGGEGGPNSLAGVDRVGRAHVPVASNSSLRKRGRSKSSGGSGGGGGGGAAGASPASSSETDSGDEDPTVSKIMRLLVKERMRGGSGPAALLGSRSALLKEESLKKRLRVLARDGAARTKKKKKQQKTKKQKKKRKKKRSKKKKDKRMSRRTSSRRKLKSKNSSRRRQSASASASASDSSLSSSSSSASSVSSSDA